MTELSRLRAQESIQVTQISQGNTLRISNKGLKHVRPLQLFPFSHPCFNRGQEKIKSNTKPKRKDSMFGKVPSLQLGEQQQSARKSVEMTFGLYATEAKRMADIEATVMALQVPQHCSTPSNAPTASALKAVPEKKDVEDDDFIFEFNFEDSEIDKVPAAVEHLKRPMRNHMGGRCALMDCPFAYREPQDELPVCTTEREDKLVSALSEEAQAKRRDFEDKLRKSFQIIDKAITSPSVRNYLILIYSPNKTKSLRIM
jgi:hypothetical protein